MSTDTTTDAPADTKPTRVKQLMAFVFRDGDGCYRWLKVPSLDAPVPDIWRGEGEAQIFSVDGDICAGARPGQVFQFELSEDGKTVYYAKKATQPYVGLIADTEARAVWRARHDAFEADREAEAAMEKDGRVKVHLELLDPIREAYRRMPEPIQAQIVAQVVRYICRGAPKKGKT